MTKLKRDHDYMRSINDLREHAVFTLQRLQEKDIEVPEAVVTAKLYDSIMSSVKLELDYSKMLGVSPNIPFIGEGQVKSTVIHHHTTRSIEDNSEYDNQEDE